MLNIMRRLRFAGLVSVAVFMTAGALAADSLPDPEGKVLLTVTGMVEKRNAESGARFDFEMLKGLGVSEIVTTTAWTQGVKKFEGVSIKQLMEELGAKGTTAEVIALNDYKVDIPVKDFSDYPVILAYQMDGERLKIRDKGPLWVVFPEDDNPELKNKKTQAKWVWQVKEIHFK